MLKGTHPIRYQIPCGSCGATVPSAYLRKRKCGSCRAKETYALYLKWRSRNPEKARAAVRKSKATKALLGAVLPGRKEVPLWKLLL
jgi:hypothetical protein